MLIHLRATSCRFAITLIASTARSREQLSTVLVSCVLGCMLIGCAPEATNEASGDSDEAVPIESGEALRVQPGSEAEESMAATPTVPADPGAPMSQPADGSSMAEPPSLAIGDPAPALQIAEWKAGEPFGSFEDGQVYVVEFWATWCGPCLQGMPHVSELQEKYGEDVTIVGVTREDAETVETFLDKEQEEGVTWREVVKYRLAIDEDGQTNDAYMRAAKQGGIPTAFIVGKTGMVEWIGHPMEMDDPLAQVVDGSWDSATAQQEFEDQQRLQGLAQKLGAMQQAGRWDEALQVLGEVEQVIGSTNPVELTRMQILMMAGRVSEMTQIGNQLLESSGDDAMLLTQVSRMMAAAGDQATLETALQAAQKAAELTESKEPIVLDTLALIHYQMGNLDEAIAWQEKAVENANGGGRFAETLEQYRAEKEEPNEEKQDDAE